MEAGDKMHTAMKRHCTIHIYKYTWYSALCLSTSDTDMHQASTLDCVIVIYAMAIHIVCDIDLRLLRAVKSGWLLFL